MKHCLEHPEVEVPRVGWSRAEHIQESKSQVNPPSLLPTYKEQLHPDKYPVTVRLHKSFKSKSKKTSKANRQLYY
jgi:hypothetical protein